MSPGPARTTSANGHFSNYVHRLQLEAPTRTPDPSGGATVSYRLIAELWGEVAAVSGDERFEADRLSGRITHHISIRHRDSLSPDHRFRLGDRVFAILSILDRDGRRRHLVCRCEEIVT